MDFRAYNREAWDREVERGYQWTVPFGPDVIEAAREGRWEVLLTEAKPVPRDWFSDLRGADVLCLASGGGQQGPVLAAAGANVTVLDNSPGQLGQDRLVAQREGLDLETVQGDMADLSRFADDSFDLVFHPLSNLFVPRYARSGPRPTACCAVGAFCWPGSSIPRSIYSIWSWWTTLEKYG
jgi:2-polyprenyl-3-methyl-5-hydroxy-6-metoxy-1,4-benzoquinol methylase